MKQTIKDMKISKGISPSLKELGLYKTAIFPIQKYTTVNATIYRIQTEYDKKFTMKKDSERRIIEVTRTA